VWITWHICIESIFNYTYFTLEFCYFEDMKGNTHIRSLTEGSWYWVNKIIVQEYIPKIGSRGLAVYSFLASLADTSQRCFPSQRYIAKRLVLILF
jgi:hypothetical protein